MSITVTDSTTTKTSRYPHTHKSDKSKNEDGDSRGNVFSSDVSKSPAPKNYPSPSNSFRENLHNYPHHASSISSPYSKIDHHEPPRTTFSITTTTTSTSSPIAIATTATVTDTTLTTFSDSGSAFHPFPQNHASRPPYSDPFAFYPSSQFRQQYEHLFQQQCIAHAIYEYQQMLRWDVNGTVPPQYPVPPYLPPQSPSTPIGGSFSYQVQHHQWSQFQQQHQNLQPQHTQSISQSHQNIMNPALPHPFPTYFPRHSQPQYERGLNLLTPAKATLAPSRHSSTFNPISVPEPNTVKLSSSESLGNAQEKTGQHQYTILRRSSSPKKYLKPKYVPLKESMYATTTTSNAIMQSKSTLFTSRSSQNYRKRSSSTPTSTISISEQGNATRINPIVTPLSPASTPDDQYQFTENSSQ